MTFKRINRYLNFFSGSVSNTVSIDRYKSHEQKILSHQYILKVLRSKSLRTEIHHPINKYFLFQVLNYAKYY